MPLNSLLEGTYVARRRIHSFDTYIDSASDNIKCKTKVYKCNCSKDRVNRGVEGGKRRRKRTRRRKVKAQK